MRAASIGADRLDPERMADAGTMTGDGFGGALQKERERRGISLQQLSRETKVGIEHLRALEEDQFRSLPGGVFRRGIVRAYLQAVGLEEQGWMQRFQRSHEAQMGGQMGSQMGAGAVEGAAWMEFAENVRRSRPNQARSIDWRWLGVIGLFLMVLVAAWLVWHFELQGGRAGRLKVTLNTSPVEKTII